MLFSVRRAIAVLGLGLVQIAAAPIASMAQDDMFVEGFGKGGGRGSDRGGAPAYSLKSWMNSDLSNAWAQGYFGQGTTVTIVDDFSSQWGYYGDLGDGVQLNRHGEWTYLEAGMVAPGANLRAHDFNSGRGVGLSRKGLNVINLSYGMMAQEGYSAGQIGWSAQEGSIISYAENGRALLSKAAGNDGVVIGSANQDGLVDYLGVALVGTQSAVFVGSLDGNGSTTNPVSLASYSNYPGLNPVIQEQYVVVGVEGDQTGLYGTSFAAPIVSGYAAVLGSKFTSAGATAIRNQILKTARTDTLVDYDPATYGQGEASISRALAPLGIK